MKAMKANLRSDVSTVHKDIPVMRIVKVNDIVLVIHRPLEVADWIQKKHGYCVSCAWSGLQATPRRYYPPYLRTIADAVAQAPTFLASKGVTYLADILKVAARTMPKGVLEKPLNPHLFED